MTTAPAPTHRYFTKVILHGELARAPTVIEFPGGWVDTICYACSTGWACHRLVLNEGQAAVLSEQPIGARIYVEGTLAENGAKIAVDELVVLDGNGSAR